MENEPENYEMRCVECGKNGNLYMLPHRDRNGNMVGVLYTCGNCIKNVKGSECIIDARRDKEIADLKSEIERKDEFIKRAREEIVEGEIWTGILSATAAMKIYKFLGQALGEEG